MSRWLFVKFRRQLCPGGGEGVLKHVLARLGGNDDGDDDGDGDGDDKVGYWR